MRRRPGRVRKWLRVCSMATFLCVAIPFFISSIRPLGHLFGDNATPWNHFGVSLDLGRLECFRSVGVPRTTTLPAAIRDKRPASMYGPLEYHYWGNCPTFDGWNSLVWSANLDLVWPLFFVGVVTLIVWWRTRVVRDGICTTCAYDLRGLPGDAPCPECGEFVGPPGRGNKELIPGA